MAEPVRIGSPRDAIAAGIAFLTEDRKGQGLVLAQSVRANFALPNLRHWSRWGWIDQRAERERLWPQHVDRLRIRLAEHGAAGRHTFGRQSAENRPGQVARAPIAEVVLFDEPTRGIDVGAKYEIYQLINTLAAQGKAILLISSELPEVLGMADRILVMHEGRITGEITDVGRSTQADILKLAVG